MNLRNFLEFAPKANLLGLMRMLNLFNIWNVSNMSISVCGHFTFDNHIIHVIHDVSPFSL